MATNLLSQQQWTSDDVHAALRYTSPTIRCVISYEISGAPYDPNRVYSPYKYGSEQERGPAQLHPQGLLNDFFRRGYIDPFSPYSAVQYMEQREADGGLNTNNWPPLRFCQ